MGKVRPMTDTEREKVREHFKKKIAAEKKWEARMRKSAKALRKKKGLSRYDSLVAAGRPRKTKKAKKRKSRLSKLFKW